MKPTNVQATAKTTTTVLVAILLVFVARAEGAFECPLTSPQDSFSGAGLDAFTPTRSGTIYDDTGAHLRLQKAGGNFSSTNTAVSDAMMAVCAADYDGDGWDDLFAYDGARKFRFYKNQTYENPEPDWDDISASRVGKFVPGDVIVDLPGTGGSSWIGCADYNGDGHLDALGVWASGDNVAPGDARMFMGAGDGSFTSGHMFLNSLGDVPLISWSQNIVSTDFNGDGRVDIIIGVPDSSSNGGTVRVYLNDGDPVAPKLVPGPILVASAGMGLRGPLGLRFDDFNGDGNRDLLYTGPSSNTIRFHPGTSATTVDPTFQTVAYPSGKGGGNTIIASDFTLDGKLDIIVITDNWNYGSHLGGESYFYENNGETAPFSDGMTKQVSFHHDGHDVGTLYDSDASTFLDYDHDPDRTLDLVVADGNHSASFFLFANRVVQTYVECGDVASGTLDLGPLEQSELVVTAARLTPSHTLAGGSITYYMSNQTPASWHEATPCAGSGIDLCVSFPNPVGRDVRWKATLCSNSTHTSTPTIEGISMRFDYKQAAVHYRAGVVVNDGVAYAGGFSQPGHRGYLHATNAGLSQTYWEASELLDARSDASRSIFTTVDWAGVTEFASSNAASLVGLLNAASEEQAAEIIAWARSPRFGVGNAAFPLSRLGAIETSTPAAVGAPILPHWYSFATSAEREGVDAFIADNATREVLVLFGSRDGMVHAIRNDATQIAAASNGTEAWAFVPPSVAADMLADETSGLVSAYPDGSPTVADVRLADGQIHTVALISGGNGGSTILALDITRTIDGPNIVGPKPLWQAIPGGGEAGRAYSKPVIARIKVDDVARFVAIVGTGPSPLDPARGRIIEAIDIASGERIWRFKAKCALTSDISIFESDDEDEPTGPTIDGVHDLVVFGDSCGYVYKLDPNVDLGPGGDWEAEEGWLDSTTTGTIDTGFAEGGHQVMALFSTANIGPPSGLGEERPIVGTIGVRPDSSTRVVLFFGTGGVESFDPTKRNQFYAVYSDTGAIRSVLEGTCNGSGLCEKFYGGVVVSSNQVLVTRTIDPEVGTSSCDDGSSEVQGVNINDDDDGQFVIDFSTALDSAIVAPLFGVSGALYTSTLSGTIVRVGSPGAVNAGDSSAAEGETSSFASGSISVVGWRYVL